ncbi:hypothetical protein NMY22_g4164 [Coprinellus aureogranulatus]|nr:hypothetical protein NMY22_g4164 [Coprinellus aureogranulatus]
MPTFTPNTNASDYKILITGATGYVGQWVLRTILNRGYHARVVVRSEAKSHDVKRMFPAYEDQGKMEFVIVEDFTKEGALDEAVKDVDGIVHVATPLPRPEEHPDDTLRIAVEAVNGVLESALENGNKLKRIVFTSTIATIWTDRAEPRTFNENDWNEMTMPKIEAGERDYMSVYFASKILAERAVWDFYEKHKPEISWDVTVLNPAFVYGPTLQPISSPTDLPTSAKLWMLSILGKLPEPPVKEAVDNGWIDVRNLGEAHVRCFEREGAGGERILACAGSYVWREWYDVVRAVAPSVLGGENAAKFVEGFPDALSGHVEPRVRFDPSKGARILGLEYRSKGEMVKAVLEQGVSEGWL